jgi:hypothetical protein
MQGRIIHRHKQNMLLALMNTAPAELPHRLIDAAVQLLRVCESPESQQPKKTPAATPASGFSYRKANSFFRERKPLPGTFGRIGAIEKVRSV